MHKTIEKSARERIEGYLSLPVGSRPSCPYFNNRRHGNKSGLRVLRGKGTPEEIAEECEIAGLHTRTAVASLPADKLKEFLVDNGLGVDCSGFAYHVLEAALLERSGKRLSRQIKTHRTGIVGKFLARLRPAENAGVATFADESNSFEIEAAEAVPGDIVVFLGTGKDKTYNHILVIAETEGTKDGLVIRYAHSYAWPSDGKYSHGAREGEISLSADDLRRDDILAGVWNEQGQTGERNYTFASARDAREVSVRRLRCMS